MPLELRSLLEELTESLRERGCDASVATMTVVVFFEDDAIGKLARERIGRLASKHPSRVIMLDATQTENQFRLDGCDWIELGVKGSEPDLLRSAVGMLRVADAPVVLLWIARGIGSDARFSALCEDARTIVYNSSLLDAGHEALRELVGYVAEHPSLPLADIAYLRLGPWQECVATFFDGKASAELRQLERVEVACGSDPEGFYLLGWLASRLQWTPTGTGALIDAAGKRVTFELRREGEPRRIASIALHSTQSNFVAQLDATGDSILLSVTGARHGTRHEAVKNPGIAALVERAILWGENDRVFYEALAAAGRILGKMGE
ncbi:MAG TPA: glucose-6-phosphate dehydrogenase assembly protein OpcA [Candidatus Cybelea sp.]